MVSLLCGLNEKKELNYFQKLVPLLFRNLGAVQLDDAHAVWGISAGAGEEPARLPGALDGAHLGVHNICNFIGYAAVADAAADPAPAYETEYGA